MANAAFSVFAGTASLTITILAAAKGAWAVAVVFGLLVVGFALRATERYWRGDH